MESAGLLSGELAYAYQHQSYDVACIKEVLVGYSDDGFKEVLAALAALNAAGKNNVAKILTSASQKALDFNRAQYGFQLELWN
ncbi:hypothetical protein C7293_04895 [filamentous cyanobacterium CCT1]|nr:hypothetical protein C7293_04895 [filamentous cyanobacterium CCT1]